MAIDIPFDLRPEGVQIDIFNTPPPAPSEKAAQDRALKFHYTLGEKSPGVDEIYQSILAGQEDRIRTNHAMDKHLEDQQFQLNILQEYLKNHEGQIDDSTLEQFRSLTKPRVPDVHAGLELNFSEKLINDLYLQPGGLGNQAANEEPTVSAAYFQVLAENVGKIERVRKKIEDTQAKHQSGEESWWNDFFEQWIPFKSWATIVGEGQSGKFFLGANLAEQVRTGWMLPYDKFVPYFESTFDAIAEHNPLDALKFAEAFMSYSGSDEFWDTFSNTIEIGSMVPFGTALKGVKTTAKLTSIAASKAKKFSIPRILSTAGKTKESTIVELTNDLKRLADAQIAVKAADQVGELTELLKVTPNIMNPEAWFQGQAAHGGPQNAQDVFDLSISYDLEKVDPTVYKALSMDGKIYSNPRFIARTRENVYDIEDTYHIDLLDEVEKEYRTKFGASEVDARDLAIERLSGATERGGMPWGYLVNGRFIEKINDAFDYSESLKSLKGKVTKDFQVDLSAPELQKVVDEVARKPLEPYKPKEGQIYFGNVTTEKDGSANAEIFKRGAGDEADDDAVGQVDYHFEGDNDTVLYIDYIRLRPKRSDGYYEEGKIGVRGMSELLKAFRNQHPNVERIQGLRISGSRVGEAAPKFDVEAAVRTPNGQVYTGTNHAWAADKAWNDIGEGDRDRFIDNLEQGFVKAGLWDMDDIEKSWMTREQASAYLNKTGPLRSENIPKPNDEVNFVIPKSKVRKARTYDFTDTSGKFTISATDEPSFLSGQIRTNVDFEPELPRLEPRSLDREFYQRSRNEAVRRGALILENFGTRNAIERLTQTSEQAAIRAAVEFAESEFGHIGDGVVDLAYYIPPERHPANIGQVIVSIKKPNALPFADEQEATRYADNVYQLKPGSYSVVNQGNSWLIQVARPIDETLPLVRQGLIETGNETPRNFINTIFGNYRSAEDINPPEIRKARKVAAHGIQGQYRFIEQLVAPVKALKGQSKRDFIRFTEAQRDYLNIFPGATVAPRGRIFNTVQDFEQGWQQLLGRLPTEAETNAYHAYLQAYEWDYIWRNLGIYRSLSRQGIRDFRLTKPDGTETVAFKARQVNNIDWTREDGILVQGQVPYFLAARAIPAAERQALQVSIDNGEYKVIQLAQPQLMPLQADFEINEMIEFVITREFNSDRISPIQIPYHAGGHISYWEPYVVKQPRARWAGARRIYTHDTSVRLFSFQEEAQQTAAHYNEALRLYRLRDPGFDNYVNANLPLEGAARLRAALDSGTLSAEEPIVVLRKGEYAWDDPHVRNFYNTQGGVENYTQSQNNLYKDVNHEYAGERNIDIATGNGSGTEENPLFTIQRPRYIDPLTTLNRAAASMSRSKYLEDLRYLAAERFVQEFQSVLATPLDQLRSNPVAALFSPKWNESAPVDLRRAAEHYRTSFVNYLHIQTDLGKNLGWVKERLYRDLVGRVGHDRAETIANSNLIKGIQDPVHSMRSLAFFEHLGLFNPAQWFKQLQTLTHLTSLAGPNVARKAVPAGFLMRALMMTNESPAHLSHFAKMASRWGWATNDFEEAYLALRRTALDIVEGEHAWRDDMADPNFFSGRVAKFLNKSTFFFKEGERATRLSAFAAAYLEWKAANPVAVLDRRALHSILLRQDAMNGNMTRASNAAWQSMGRGILSVPLQFATYPIRIMEQFMSRRLSSAERARMLLTYSLLYGIPVGIGVTPAGIYPWYQDLTQALLERGITEDPNMAVEVLHKGLIETLFHLVGGRQYNAGEALGVGGLQITKDIFKGEFLEVLLGASGSSVGGIFNGIVPLATDMASIFYDGISGKGPLVAADFADAMRNVSSVNSAFKLYYALAYAKYISKGESFIDDFSPFDAVLSTVFGVNPQSLDNIARMIESNQEFKASQDYARKQMIKYIRRGLQAEDKDVRDAYFRAAQTWRVSGDFTFDQYPSIIQEAAEGVESLMERINRSYFIKGRIPQSQVTPRLEGLKEQQED